MLIPSPGRFVFGLTLILELCFIMLAGLLANSLVKKLKLNQESSIIIISSVIFATVLFKELMILINPEIMMTLGFVIYMVPVSYFFLGYVFNDTQANFSQRLHFTFKHMVTFSVFALSFFLVRDIAGYGTITFFGSNYQIIEKVILSPEKVGGLSLLATIPGALIFSSLLLFSHIIIRNKMNIVKNTEVEK